MYIQTLVPHYGAGCQIMASRGMVEKLCLNVRYKLLCCDEPIKKTCKTIDCPVCAGRVCLVAKEEKLSFKYTIPYFLTGAAMLFGTGASMRSSEKALPDVSLTYPQNNLLESRVDSIDLIDSLNADYSVVSMDALLKTPIRAIAQRYDVVYTRADGNQFKRSGGTRAWRNNNPGCLRYSQFAVTQGAIGKAGGFAVFPDEKTGRAAIGALLRSDKYCNLSISQAIYKYAPPHENDTQRYKSRLQKMTGLAISTKIRDLSDEQLSRVVQAICVIEGWRIGTEVAIAPVKATEKMDTAKIYAMAQQVKLNQLRQNAR